jgi:putative ABC transport system permease protein
LVRQFVVESLLLALLGGAAGLLVARGGLPMILGLVPQAVPRLWETTVDTRVLAFALGTIVLAALLFGIGPALALWKTNVNDVLKTNERTSSSAVSAVRLQKSFVMAELALTLLLLSGAGLMVKSFWRMHTYPPGFEPDRVLTMRVEFSAPRYRDTQTRRAYVDELLRRVRRVSGVEAAGITTNADGGMRLLVEGAPFPPKDPREPVATSSTSAGYAGAIGMRLVRGRWMSDAEASAIIVINESLARREFAGQDAIGKRIQIGGPPGEPGAVFATIVGVVADLKYSKLDASPAPELFFDYAHAPPSTGGIMVVLRTKGDPLAAARAVRKLIADIDEAQPIDQVRTLEQVLAKSIAPRRFYLFLLGTFATVALLLSVIGIYGVMSYAVVRRTREIGIRLALGARRNEVVRMVVRQGMGIALAGIVIGLIAAIGLTRLMVSLLYDVEPTEPTDVRCRRCVALHDGFYRLLGTCAQSVARKSHRRVA